MSEQIKASAVPCGAGRAMVNVEFRGTKVTMVIPLGLWYDQKKFKEAIIELFNGKGGIDAGN